MTGDKNREKKVEEVRRLCHKVGLRDEGGLFVILREQYGKRYLEQLTDKELSEVEEHVKSMLGNKNKKTRISI